MSLDKNELASRSNSTAAYMYFIKAELKIITVCHLCFLCHLCQLCLLCHLCHLCLLCVLCHFCVFRVFCVFCVFLRALAFRVRSPSHKMAIESFAMSLLLPLSLLPLLELFHCSFPHILLLSRLWKQKCFSFQQPVYNAMACPLLA